MRNLFSLALFVLLPSWPAGATSDAPKKLHLDLKGGDGTAFALTLPVDPDHSSFGEALAKVKLDANAQATGADRLRKAWSEVKRSGGVEKISNDDGHSRMSLSEKRGDAVIETTDDADPKSHTTIRVPEVAFDALLSGSGDTVDFDAALRTLRNRGRGEVISVSGDDGGSVRIWLE